jgi:hypothetical protein
VVAFTTSAFGRSSARGEDQLVVLLLMVAWSLLSRSKEPTVLRKVKVLHMRINGTRIKWQSALKQMIVVARGDNRAYDDR